MLPAAFARAIQANTRARLENIHVLHLHRLSFDRIADPVGASPLITWLLQICYSGSAWEVTAADVSGFSPPQALVDILMASEFGKSQQGMQGHKVYRLAMRNGYY